MEAHWEQVELVVQVKLAVVAAADIMVEEEVLGKALVEEVVGSLLLAHLILLILRVPEVVMVQWISVGKFKSLISNISK